MTSVHICRAADVEAIKQLKARYFRHLDTKDWSGLRAVFTDDATFEVVTPAPRVTHGADAVIAMMRSSVGDAVTVHHGHQPEIEPTSENTANGIWAMEDLIWWAPGSPSTHLHGFGHYHETYRKDDERWRIASVRLTRIRREVMPG